jgi:hypothetical protein
MPEEIEARMKFNVVAEWKYALRHISEVLRLWTVYEGENLPDES